MNPDLSISLRDLSIRTHYKNEFYHKVGRIQFSTFFFSYQSYALFCYIRNQFTKIIRVIGGTDMTNIS